MLRRPMRRPVAMATQRSTQRSLYVSIYLLIDVRSGVSFFVLKQTPMASGYITRGPRLRGRYVDNRDKTTQEVINRFADEFLEYREKKLIASLLEKPTTELKYDIEEAQVLRSRADPRFLAGLRGAGWDTVDQGYPLSQFYDMCLTIETLINFLRGLEIQVHNLDSIGNADMIKYLCKHILHESFIPWEFVELDPSIVRAGKDEKKVQGLRLGEDMIYGPVVVSTKRQWPLRWTDIPPGDEYKSLRDTEAGSWPVELRSAPDMPDHADNAVAQPLLVALPNPRVMPWHAVSTWVVRHKTLYEKAVDEAELFRYPALHAIASMGQGLFLVFETEARLFQLWDDAAPGRVHPRMSDTRIPSGSWINSFVPNTRLIPFGRGPANNKAEAIRNAQPKAILDYPGNWLGRMAAKLYNDENVAKTRYAYSGDLVTLFSRDTIEGNRASLADTPGGIERRTDLLRAGLGGTALGGLPLELPHTRDTVLRENYNGGALPRYGWLKIDQSIAWAGRAPATFNYCLVNNGLIPLTDRVRWADPLPGAPGAPNDHLGGAHGELGVPIALGHAHNHLGYMHIFDIRGIQMRPDTQIPGDILPYPQVNQVWTAEYASMYFDTTQIPDAMVDEILPQRLADFQEGWETQLTDHPIWACRRLARAFNSSGVGQVLIHMYHQLQRLFTAKYQTSTIDVTSTDPRKLLPNQTRGASLPLTSCPIGLQPRYFDTNDNVVPDEEATELRNGVRYLKSHINPKHIECVPRVRAPADDLSTFVPATRNRSSADLLYPSLYDENREGYTSRTGSRSSSMSSALSRDDEGSLDLVGSVSSAWRALTVPRRKRSRPYRVRLPRRLVRYVRIPL
jgi:hypothetical protein